MISKGRAQGGGALLLKLLIILRGLSPLPNSCIGFDFQCVLTLLSKCFVLLGSMLHGYRDISSCWLYYISIKLNYHIYTLKVSAWLQLGHTQNVGVAVPRAPLLKFLEITTAVYTDDRAWARDTASQGIVASKVAPGKPGDLGAHSLSD